MKLVGLVGSNAELSYNRKLLQFIEKHYKGMFDFEILEIKDVPLFNQSDDQTNSPVIQELNKKITASDGVIIASPEHNHTITPALKSVLEWLSFKIHPLENKPVMIVGASYYDQGSSRAQLHLRQVLDAPGVNAIVLPGNEFLLGKVKEAFDSKGDLIDKGTVSFLTSVLEKFIHFVRLINVVETPQAPLPEEDLTASGKVPTTIEGVDMHADDWVEKAAEKVGAVEGNTYVKLNRGILTVDQLNYFFDSMPMELTYADANNQFIYYNYNSEAADMLASRRPGQVGNPLEDCHPEKAYKNVGWVVQQLRSGRQDVVRVHVPKHQDKYVVHSYQAMHDEEGNYVGINEYILDFKPIVEWYLKQTGQTLTGGHVDGDSSASKKDEVDGASSASQKEEEKVDGTTSASTND